jgi:hypothetical protein
MKHCVTCGGMLDSDGSHFIPTLPEHDAALDAINLLAQRVNGLEASIGELPSLSIRDWFAGQALQGMIANSALASHTLLAGTSVALDAYRYADAMLKERAKGLSNG